MVTTDDRHAPPKAYRPPTLTVYGSVRDLTRGTGIGAPDNGVTPSHSMIAPYGGKKSK